MGDKDEDVLYIEKRIIVKVIEAFFHFWDKERTNEFPGCYVVPCDHNEGCIVSAITMKGSSSSTLNDDDVIGLLHGVDDEIVMGKLRTLYALTH